MWINWMILAFLGLSFGLAISAGLFAFLIGLGVVSDFADRTHTGKYVTLYEDCIVLGGILGNLFWIYEAEFLKGGWLLAGFGLLSGIFVGCWSMALADISNNFPIFIRRAKITTGLSWLIVGMALGKSLGALLYFYMRW